MFKKNVELKCCYCSKPAVVIAYGFSMCEEHAKKFDETYGRKFV